MASRLLGGPALRASVDRKLPWPYYTARDLANILQDQSCLICLLPIHVLYPAQGLPLCEWGVRESDARSGTASDVPCVYEYTWVYLVHMYRYTYTFGHMLIHIHTHMCRVTHMHTKLHMCIHI